MLKILYYITSIISGVVTVTAFWVANKMTATFDPSRELYGGGNGNPGIFVFAFCIVFILYFALTVVLMFESFHLKKTKKTKGMLLAVYFFIASIISTRMLWQANQLQRYINENHPFMQVSLFSPFSNQIFFNVWTFIGAIAILAMLSFLMPKPKNIT